MHIFAHLEGNAKGGTGQDLYAYIGDVDRWESMPERIVPELRENPYFRWLVTERG